MCVQLLTFQRTNVIPIMTKQSWNNEVKYVFGLNMGNYKIINLILKFNLKKN